MDEDVKVTIEEFDEEKYQKNLQENTFSDEGGGIGGDN